MPALAHPPAAELQQQVDVAAVGEVPVEADDVRVAQAAVQLPLLLHLHRHPQGPPTHALGEVGMRHPPPSEPSRRERALRGSPWASHPPTPGPFRVSPRLTLFPMAVTVSRARGVTLAA